MNLTIKDIMTLPKNDLKNELWDGAKHRSKHGCVWGGDTNICLVSHIDKYQDNKTFPDICYDSVRGIYWSIDNQLGGDDRAGVFASLEIYKMDKRPFLLFTDLEEMGCMGIKHTLTKGHMTDVLKNMDYFIGLDRTGNNDVVFYCEESQEFKNIFLKMGYQERIGSTSDVRIISESLHISSANVSVGYHKAHTFAEYLVEHELQENIEKVKEIIAKHDKKKYTCTTKDIVVKKYEGYTGMYGYVPVGYEHHYPSVPVPVMTRKAKELLEDIELRKKMERIEKEEKGWIKKFFRPIQ